MFTSIFVNNVFPYAKRETLTSIASLIMEEIYVLSNENTNPDPYLLENRILAILLS